MKFQFMRLTLASLLLLSGASTNAHSQEVLKVFQDIWSSSTSLGIFDMASDLDGDGFGDLVVGDEAFRLNVGSNEGFAFLRSSRKTSENLHEWLGEPNDFVGEHVCCIGDVTGDGIADLALSSRVSTRIVSGSSFEIVHQFAFEAQTAAALGDLNGDGIGDFIFGFPSFGIGGAFAFHGGTFEIVHSIIGESEDMLGATVESLGDVNGDGVPDYAVGGPGIFGRFRPGHVRIISGATGGLIRRIEGFHNSDLFGGGLAAPGDVNGDGVPDIAIGASRLRRDGGQRADGVVLFYEAVTGNLIGRFDGTPRYITVGHRIRNAGDINGDGTSDVMVSAPREDVQGVADVIVLDGWTRSPIYTVTSPPQGIQNRALGFELSSAGDWNQDDIPDLALANYGPEEGRGVFIFSGAQKGIRPFGNACVLGVPGVPSAGPGQAVQGGPTTTRETTVPRIGADVPRPTDPRLRIHLSRVAPGLKATLLIGSSRENWNGKPLPRDLGFLGLPGCELLVNPSVVRTMQTQEIRPGEGAVTFEMNMPNEPSVAGRKFYVQWLVEGPPGSRPWGAVTKALEIDLPATVGTVK